MQRLVPSLLVLVLGFVLGALYSSGPPSSVKAQGPRPLGQINEDFPVLDSPKEGGRVTVIEARKGRDVAGSGDLIGFSHVDGSGTQVITLVDTQKAWMAVYHIGSEGEIRLVSSRAIDADFTLQLNATSPTPEDIRRLQGVSPQR